MKRILLGIKVCVWKITLGLFQDLRYRFLLRFRPRVILDKKWEACFGYPIDWQNPRDLNEVIHYLLVNTNTSQWSRLSDKVLVRDYVCACGFENLLIPLYGVWKSANDIDFKTLPERFVLKCNHDSGSTMIIDKSNSTTDYQKIRAFYAERLKRDFGNQGELHYRKIKPRILAEQLLEDTSLLGNMAPVDYKVWCFNGKPHHVLTCYGRFSNQLYLNVYDLDWICHPECSVDDGHHRIGDGQLPKPASLPIMLKAAEKLSNGFPEVRVDFYDINGKLYFGEMTFTSQCGRIKYYTPEFLRELGKQAIL